MEGLSSSLATALPHHWIPLGYHFLFNGFVLVVSSDCKRDFLELEGLFCLKERTKSLILNSNMHLLGSVEVENKIVFREGLLSVQNFKLSFVYNSWDWNRRIYGKSDPLS